MLRIPDTPSGKFPDAVAAGAKSLEPHGAPPRWREQLAAHWLRLDQRARRQRFLSDVSNACVLEIAYRAMPDLVLGHNRDNALRGSVEAYGGSDVAEIGISVEPAYQNCGIGSQILDRALDRLRRRGVRSAVLIYDHDNAVVRHLVMKRNGRIEGGGGTHEGFIDLN